MNSNKLIYILGYERSGSTLLHNLIGQVKGYFAVGELRHIWQRGIDNRPCGCGEPFSECEFWKDVYKREDPNQKHIRESFFFFQKLPFVRLFNRKKLTAHKAYLKDLYIDTIDKSKTDYLIDSSKSVMHLQLLSELGFEIYTILIIRDPRGIEYSMYKRKQLGQIRYKNHSLWRNILKIDVINWMSKKYMSRFSKKVSTVKYEDLVENPKEALDKITGDLGVSLDTSFISKNEVLLTPTHSVAGSPSRHSTGKLHLKLDEKWKESLPLKSKKRIESLSWTYKNYYKGQ